MAVTVQPKKPKLTEFGDLKDGELFTINDSDYAGNVGVKLSNGWACWIATAHPTNTNTASYWAKGGWPLDATKEVIKYELVNIEVKEL